MWERGVLIYGTSGVFNNFPSPFGFMKYQRTTPFILSRTKEISNIITQKNHKNDSYFWERERERERERD